MTQKRKKKPYKTKIRIFPKKTNIETVVSEPGLLYHVKSFPV
jgi:hypothetical protein